MVVLSSSKRLVSWLYPHLDADLVTSLAVMARQQVVVSKWEIEDLSDHLVGQTFKRILEADSHNNLGEKFLQGRLLNSKLLSFYGLTSPQIMFD